jgi:hypothetical protein
MEGIVTLIATYTHAQVTNSFSSTMIVMTDVLIFPCERSRSSCLEMANPLMAQANDGISTVHMPQNHSENPTTVASGGDQDIFFYFCCFALPVYPTPFAFLSLLFQLSKSQMNKGAWPHAIDTKFGVDFTLYTDAESLILLPVPFVPAGHLPEVMAALRVPASMKNAFKLLMRMFPEDMRQLYLRQNWMLLRDAICMFNAPSLPQGLGMPPPLPEAAEQRANDDPDFVPDDVPVQCGMARLGHEDSSDVWNSDGDCVLGGRNVPGCAVPWIDAMGAQAKKIVRQLFEDWASIVNARNAAGMYVPLFAVGAGVMRSAEPQSRLVSFAQFYHRPPVDAEGAEAAAASRRRKRDEPIPPPCARPRIPAPEQSHARHSLRRDWR